MPEGQAPNTQSLGPVKGRVRSWAPSKPGEGRWGKIGSAREELWNETYISKAAEGRAGAGELRRKAPRRGLRGAQVPLLWQGPGDGHLSESRPIMFLRAFLRLVLLGDLTAGRSSELCSSFRSSISMTTT